MTKLYKQLSLVESDGEESHNSSMSEGIELRYQMLDDEELAAEKNNIAAQLEESKIAAVPVVEEKPLPMPVI